MPKTAEYPLEERALNQEELFHLAVELSTTVQKLEKFFDEKETLYFSDYARSKKRWPAADNKGFQSRGVPPRLT